MRTTLYGRRWRQWPLLAAALLLPLGSCLAAPDPAADKATAESHAQAEQRLKEAQERLETAARELANLSLEASGDAPIIEREVRVKFGGRAQLGMMIEMHGGAGVAGAGVHVMSVSPGGPAEAAGVRAKDEIVALNGTALHGDGRQSAAHLLLGIMHTAKPGEPMALEFRHEGKLIKTSIVPKKVTAMNDELDLPDLPEMQAMKEPDGMPGMRRMRIMLRDAGAFGATELVELTPALGSYFGADKGLLVVRAPTDARFKLQDGDVILDIDGRVPGNVAHAMQILGSYHAGETVHLRLMRQKQPLALGVEVPES